MHYTQIKNITGTREYRDLKLTIYFGFIDLVNLKVRRKVELIERLLNY